MCIAHYINKVVVEEEKEGNPPTSCTHKYKQTRDSGGQPGELEWCVKDLG